VKRQQQQLLWRWAYDIENLVGKHGRGFGVQEDELDASIARSISERRASERELDIHTLSLSLSLTHTHTRTHTHTQLPLPSHLVEVCGQHLELRRQRQEHEGKLSPLGEDETDAQRLIAAGQAGGGRI
jgi:hypothetical protein